MTMSKLMISSFLLALGRGAQEPTVISDEYIFQVSDTKLLTYDFKSHRLRMKGRRNLTAPWLNDYHNDYPLEPLRLIYSEKVNELKEEKEKEKLKREEEESFKNELMIKITEKVKQIQDEEFKKHYEAHLEVIREYDSNGRLTELTKIMRKLQYDKVHEAVESCRGKYSRGKDYRLLNILRDHLHRDLEKFGSTKRKPATIRCNGIQPCTLCERQIPSKWWQVNLTSMCWYLQNERLAGRKGEELADELNKKFGRLIADLKWDGFRLNTIRGVFEYFPIRPAEEKTQG